MATTGLVRSGLSARSWWYVATMSNWDSSLAGGAPLGADDDVVMLCVCVLLLWELLKRLLLEIGRVRLTMVSVGDFSWCWPVGGGWFELVMVVW